jgi:hypothetical protein
VRAAATGFVTLRISKKKERMSGLQIVKIENSIDREI